MMNKSLFSNVLSLAWNLLMVYVCYFVCRLTFLLTNFNLFSEQFEWGYMCRLFGAGVIFDIFIGKKVKVSIRWSGGCLSWQILSS